MIKQSVFPQRINQELYRLQYQSEYIVAAVQLCIIALLTTIMWVTPVNYSPDAPIHSAFLGLSLFSILVLVRLWFAYTLQLNRILLAFFVVAEMALLIFIIWSYNLEFESTPSIILKNPHINYIFVLIVLRSLRFEPIWVLLSGSTAIIGWSFIVWYVLHISHANIITWDYVTYASTRSVYLGAEFDKLLAISLVTLVTAFALTRAKSILRQAVGQTSAVSDLSRFFDNAVVEKITQAEVVWTPGKGEMRQAVIMFIDLRGFSKLSEKLKAQDLLSLLSEYQRLVVPVVQKHQGCIDKFMGDGILASFGAVIPSENYAADALNAADEIMSVIQSWKDKQKKLGNIVDIGMGLASGEILTGSIGNAQRLEYTVIGEAVNIAAKLEKHNKTEGVHGLATHALLKEAIKQNYHNYAGKEILLNRTVAGIEQKIDLVILA